MMNPRPTHDEIRGMLKGPFYGTSSDLADMVTQLLAEVEAVTKRMDAWRAAAEAIEEETQWSPWYDDGPAPDSAPDLFVTARELDPEVKS